MRTISANHPMPRDVVVLERGWLSSNNVLLIGDEDTAAVVDTGYVSHSEQTETLIRAAIGTRSLVTIVNTHGHSDHVGGNARLQGAFPVEICVPAGIWDAVTTWDASALSYEPTGQRCDRFSAARALAPGDRTVLSGRTFDVLGAPGHDPHSLALFDARDGVLISADALWENGFGVVFPELDAIEAFDEVESVLDLLSRLPARWIIPGHGSPFQDLHGAIERARRLLARHRSDPASHARHAAKVLIKFRMLEWRECARSALLSWAKNVPLLSTIHMRYSPREPIETWLEGLVEQLVNRGALRKSGANIHNHD